MWFEGVKVRRGNSQLIKEIGSKLKVNIKICGLKMSEGICEDIIMDGEC
jgi:hypothetical protein